MKKEFLWLSRFVVVDAINEWLKQNGLWATDGEREQIEWFEIVNGDVRCKLKQPVEQPE